MMWPVCHRGGIMDTISDVILRGFAEADWMNFDVSTIPIEKKAAIDSLKEEVASVYKDLNSALVKGNRHTRFQIPHTTFRRDWSR
jgi:hypothetical protein